MGCEGYYKVYDLVKITKDGLLDLFLFLFNHNSINSYYYDDISSFNLFVMDEYLEDEEKNVQYYEEIQVNMNYITKVQIYLIIKI